MKKISLTQGKFALVDDQDFEELSKYKWFAIKNNIAFYAGRMSQRVNGKRKILLMHRVIWGTKPDEFLDHRDRNGLNNQRSNLRIATQWENARNRTKYSNNSSGYKGVSWYGPRNEWVAKIRVNDRLIHLGYFSDRLEAARVYNTAALTYHKDFARLNKIHA